MRPRRGPGWSEGALLRDLEEYHRTTGASPASRRNLRALAEGAPCVITGQQPALWGGPLYCAWKLTAAVAAARELSRRWERRVVPVYWLGADDSDFQEARGAWLWSARGEALRAELPTDAHREGRWVGALDGGTVARIERAALEAAGPGPGGEAAREDLEHLRSMEDLGRRTAARYLRLFAADGLVVVDARLESLRAAARPLLARYAARAAEVAAAVDERGAVLRRRGLPTPLVPEATRSGLFRVRDGRREKVEAEQLTAAVDGKDPLSPSVLLRPLVQDALLAPVAAVLGPAELRYHAQLAPAYDLLGVEAAAWAPRPHLALWPASLPWPDEPARQAAVLRGGEETRRILGEEALPASWRRAGAALTEDLGAAVERFTAALGPTGREKAVRRGGERILDGGRRLVEQLLTPAMQRRAQDAAAWNWAPEWMAVRGTPQERAFSLAALWWWYGHELGDLLGRLGEMWMEDRGAAAERAYRARLPEEVS
jgi:hypothetical protein